MIHQPQTEHDVEAAELPQVDVEDVALYEPVAAGVDLVDLEDQPGLIYVHLSAIDGDQVITTVLKGQQRPVAGVAAQIEHTLAFE